MKNVKVEWCMNFIKKAFEKKQCKGIEVGCFWDMVERSGLWERGTYGTPMSEALEKLTKVEAISDENGNYLYTVFRLAYQPHHPPGGVTPGERKMNIVKEINGLKIERREHKGNEYFVIWFEDGGFFKTYSLNEAVEYAMTF